MKTSLRKLAANSRRVPNDSGIYPAPQKGEFIVARRKAQYQRETKRSDAASTRPWCGVYPLIIRVSLGLTIGLMPIVYFTRLPEWWEWPKAFILYAGVTVALVGWLVWSLKRRRLMARFGWFELILLGLLAMGGLSTIWSVQPYVSLVGQTGTQADTLVSLFFLGALAWLLKTTTPPSAVRWYLYIWLGSFSLVVLGSLLQIGGVPVWPGANLGRTFEPTGNSATIFALFSAIIFLTAWHIRRTTTAKLFRLLFDLLLAGCLVLFIYLDRPYGSLMLMTGAIVLTVFGPPDKLASVIRRRIRIDWRLAAAFIIALTVLFVDVQGLAKTGPIVDTSLPSGTSARIAWNSFKHQPILGTGPATFYYDFVSYRPASYNLSALSELRFTKASNYWWQLAATWGLLSLILFIWLMSLGISRALYQTAPTRQISNQLSPQPIGWLLLWLSLSLFLTAGNLVLLVWLWASLGLAMAGQSSSNRDSWPERPAWLTIPVAAVILLGLIIGWYGLTRVWAAPFYIHQASQAVSATRPIPEVRELIDRAIKLDPWQASYRLRLAEVNIVEAQLLANQANPDKNKIITAAQAGIDAGRAAERLDPKNPAVLETSIQFYQGLQGIVAGVNQVTAEFYRRLSELEPNNASTYVEWGKAELLAAQESMNSDDQTNNQSAELVKSALTHFETALTLKPEDVDALYHQALSYELLGDRAKAKTMLKTLAQAYPNEPDILFEIGRQERLDNNLDEALRLLTKALELAPKSAPIRLELASAYEAQGNLDAALTELKLVQTVQPDNEQLKQRIADLEAKKSAVTQ